MNRYVALPILSLLASPVFAAAPDTTAIETAINDNAGAATAVTLVFIAVVLGLKALKLLKRAG